MEKLLKSKKNILQITPFFSPNIGGVETHLNDLVSELAKREINSYVLTYQPVMSDVKAKSIEILFQRVYIVRLEVLRNLFIKLEPYPILDFLLLTPGLLFYSIYFLILNNKKVDIIHAHGLNAAFIARILKYLFNKPILVSTHVTYSFGNSLLGKIVYTIFNSFDHLFTLSKASKKELLDLGVIEKRITVYKYWVDQEIFKIRNQKVLRDSYNFENNEFIIFFAGRLIEKKGVKPLIEGFNLLNNSDTKLIIAGTGPLEDYVKENTKINKNIVYVGGLDSNQIKDYYSISDTLIIPSTHDEGFGRVILEALSSGIPVIGSNRGGIPEAVDDKVSILIDVSPENIKKSILDMKKMIEKNGKKNIQETCREFAEKNYSCDNINKFIDIYEKNFR